MTLKFEVEESAELAPSTYMMLIDVVEKNGRSKHVDIPLGFCSLFVDSAGVEFR
jgi:hypothetical protein